MAAGRIKDPIKEYNRIQKKITRMITNNHRAKAREADPTVETAGEARRRGRTRTRRRSQTSTTKPIKPMDLLRDEINQVNLIIKEMGTTAATPARATREGTEMVSNEMTITTKKTKTMTITKMTTL